MLHYCMVTFSVLFLTILAGSVGSAGSAADLAPDFNLTIVTYGSPNAALTGGLPYTAPAYELGVEEIRTAYGYNIQHVLVEQDAIVTCEDLESYCYLVAEYYYNIWDRQSLFVLTLPGCDELVTLAHLSQEWNTLILSSGSAFPEPHHNTLYPTAVSFSAVNFAVLTDTFAAIFAKYSWGSISVIYDTWGHNSFYAQLADTLRHLLGPPKYMNMHLQFNPINTNLGVSEELRRATLLQVKNSSRVVLLAFRADETRRFMATAMAMNLTNPEYVYFTAEPFRSEEFYGSLKANGGDVALDVAKQAFQSLLQLTGKCSSTRTNSMKKRLLEEIKQRSRLAYGIHYTDKEEPSEIALASYYSVKTLGVVLNKLLTSSSPSQVYNGRLLAEKFSSPSWQLDNDTSIGIDEYGDRMMDLCVQSYNAETDSYSQTVMYYDSTLTTLTAMAPIKWRTENNTPPPNEPRCGFSGDKPIPGCMSGDPPLSIALIAGVTVPVVFICLMIGLFITWKLRQELALKDESWKMGKEELAETATQFKPSRISRNSAFSLSTMGKDPKHIRRLKGNAVWVVKIAISRSFTLNRQKRVILREMKVMANGNLAHLIGIIVESTYLQFVYEFCSKGSLNHLMDKINVDWEFRAALLSDLLEGVTAIHSSTLHRHGYLNPFTCLVDKRFTLKISECGLYDLTRDILTPHQEESRSATLTYTNIERWLPPEVRNLDRIWTSVRDVAGIVGSEADIYAVGGIMATVMEDQGDILRSEGSSMSLAKSTDLERLIAACQISIPQSRPGIDEVKRTFYQKTGVKTGGFLESLVRRMQKYALKLEFAVKDRTDALNVERRLCEKLLVEMLPKPIVDMLLAGCAIQPEHFHGVTIFFSVIVGFVEFVASQSPLAVIDFLNYVFSCFDDVLPSYDVYKVETISDCYMVVSGLPTPNGDLHAAEICRMSLHLLAVFRRTADALDMQVKIGLHSGSCAAGVVGSKRPRYCLFGDTVNTASRLATHGKPSKIHMSTATAALVMEVPDFRLIDRGVVELKGKGKERTFWLERN